MLTFDQLQTIAAILGWTVPEVEESITDLNHSFMQPCVDFCARNPETGEFEPGFYHQLSAPGYIDCTDWSGPFETEEAAVADMLRTYCD